MTQAPTRSSAALRQFAPVLRSLWRDRLAIVAVACALAFLGFMLGFLNQSVSSRAQLLLTPMPLRAATTEDDLAQMVAEPMDIRTASLICTSDEVFQETMEELRALELADPPEDLQDLRDAFSYEVTIAKETPYDTTFSPLLVLQAKAADPHDAKVMVDTWAEHCVLLAQRYQERQQAPAVEALAIRAGEVGAALEEAEAELEAFRRENNLEMVRSRMERHIQLLADYVEKHAELQESLRTDTAKLAASQQALAEEEPTRDLHWRANSALMSALGLSAQGAGEGEASPTNALVQEDVNPVYDTVSEDVVALEADVEGHTAGVAETQRLLQDLGTELAALEAQFAQVQRRDKELERRALVLEEAYQNAALKEEYARIAGGVKQPQLQILAVGAEWEPEYLRNAVLQAISMFIVGLLAAAAVSVGLRLLILPALEEA